MNLEIEKPYPEIKVSKQNSYYSKILLESYSGQISEDTAIHEYTYQNIILKSKNKKLANALLKISITEMKHLSFLGQLIKLLGEKPEFKTYNYFTNNYTPWNANYINYTTDVNKMLLHNIKMEELAIKNYKKTISLIDDIHIKKIINRIIEDEMLHIKIFKSFLNN